MTDASGSRKEKSTRKPAGGRKTSSARKPASAGAGQKTGATKKTGVRKPKAETSAAQPAAAPQPEAPPEAPPEPRRMPRRTPAIGSNASGARLVQCYHCRQRFEVSVIAESTTCPGCNQRVIVGDVIVDTLRPVRAVQTCGKIVVKEKARVNAQIVEAHEGLEVFGGLAGNVLSGGPVIIGPKAQWAGDCRAPSLEIHQGARIESGTFVVPDDSLGLSDLPLRAVPAGGRRASRR